MLSCNTYACLAMNKQVSIRAPKAVSPIESFFLLHESLGFEMFEFFDPQTIVFLSRTNSRMLSLVCLYRRKRWNIEGYLRPYFRHVQRALVQIEGVGAVIHGPLIQGFFARTPRTSYKDILDIYVERSAAVLLAQKLSREQYSFQPQRYQNSKFEKALSQSVRPITRSLARAVGISVGGTDNQGVSAHFLFERHLNSRHPSVRAKIVVHVVECDPWHHVLFISEGESWYNSSQIPLTRSFKTTT